MKKIIEYLKKLLGLNKKAGFTMIELLIVIAVLGILAVAVLSAINPIEQINRGKDTGSRSDSEQVVSAIDRYYATKGYYPWQIGATDTENDGTVWGIVGDTWTDTDDPVGLVLDKLSSGGSAEIKTAFVERISASGYNTLNKFNGGDQGNSTYLCFIPKSGAFKEEAWKRCNENADFGTLPTDFPAEACPADNCVGETLDDATACHICLP